MGRNLRTVVLLACLACAATLFAQEGHPLVGSWHGDWGFDATVRRDLTLVVDYTPDGASVAGMANPGYDSAPLQNIQITIPKPTEWNVRFAVDLKDKSGKMTRYVATGRLDKIGSDRRTLTGTWSAGTTKGDFKMTRDRDYSR
jgi:hypothetical protein